MKQAFSTLFAFLLVAVIIIGLIFGIHALWTGSWALARANANQQAHLNRNQWGYQQTLREQVTKDIATIKSIDVQITQTSGAESAALQAQRIAIVDQMCHEATQIQGDPLPATQAAFVSQNC